MGETPNESDRLSQIVDILMHDYDSARAEIRAAESRHEKASLWLSSGLLAATAVSFNEDFRVGFVFIPLVIIAYYSHRLYSHTLHIQTLSVWVQRIEDVIDKIVKTSCLLDWERTFARLRLKSFTQQDEEDVPTSHSLKGRVKLLSNVHHITEFLMLLPSLAVMGVCVLFGPILAVPQLVKLIDIEALLFVLLYLLMTVYLMLFVGVLVLTLKSKDDKHLQEERRKSVNKLLVSLGISRDDNGDSPEHGSIEPES